MADLITPTAERESLGGGVYRTTISLAPIAYADASGVLRRIAADWSDGDGTYPHVVSAARMRVRTAPNGDRLLLPVPGDDDAWFSISSPYIHNGTSWVQPSLGTFTRSGNQLTATAANVITRINHAGHYIKAEYELLNGWTPQNGQFAYRVGLNGLTRPGGTLLYNGTPVMSLRKPVAYDADNTEDTRTIAHEFVQLGGNWYVLFTLPSLAGMARPVVDPTFTSQPDATAGMDTWIDQANADTNRGTDTRLYATLFASSRRLRSLIKFDLSSIPAGSTVTSSTLTLNSALNGTIPAHSIYRILSGNSGWVEAQATWNIQATGTPWAGAAGLTTADTDYHSTAIGSYASFAATSGTAYDATLNTAQTETMIANNYGMLLFADDETTIANVQMWRSSDESTAGLRPQLVVEYTTGPAIPVLMQQYRRRRG